MKLKKLLERGKVQSYSTSEIAPERNSLLFRFNMLAFHVSVCLLLRTSPMMTPDSSTMWTLTTASPWKGISSSGPATHSRPGTGLFKSLYLYWNLSISATEELHGVVAVLIQCSWPQSMLNNVKTVVVWASLVPARDPADSCDLCFQALVLHPEQSASLSEEI